MKDKDYYIIVASICFFSGFINIITLTYFGYPISHYSGTFTSVAKYIYDIRFYKKLIELIIMIFCFMGGSILSSIVGSNFQEINIKRYGKIIVVFGCIVLISYFLDKTDKLFLFFLTLTMGFQNGMSIRFKGSLIRSTHMTGNLTDLGSYIGKVLKGEKDKIENIFLSALEIGQYILGGVVALILLVFFKSYILLLYGILYISCGLYMSSRK